MGDTDELREAVTGIAQDGKASCKRLLEIAREKDVSPRVVGRVCDELKIRICACQLGCFK